MQRPRLLVLTSTYPRWREDPEPGFVHELTRRLTDDFEVCVLAPHAAGAPVSEALDGVQVRRFRYCRARWETLVNDGGIVTNLKRQPWKWLLVPLFLFAQFAAAWRLVRRWRPDVIHAHWLLPQGLLAALLRVLDRTTPPFLVTAHGADLHTLDTAPMRALKRFAARRAAAATVVSDALCRRLAALGVREDDISIQPMGVDLHSLFTPDPAVPRDANELLFVGRLVEKKGLGGLLDAMPAILARNPDARLTIVGFGPEQQERRAQAHRHGLGDHVHFTGAVPQARLPAFYRRAAVLVAPFTRAASGDEEGLGLVAVEAAGCGCRLVLGDVPAVRGAFAGLPGVELVAADDPASLAEACLRALSQGGPGDALAAALRARFDWSSRSREYARILLGLARPPLAPARARGAE